jgi:hypothetical protein
MIKHFAGFFIRNVLFAGVIHLRCSFAWSILFVLPVRQISSFYLIKILQRTSQMKPAKAASATG